jgi:junctophilin
MANAQAKAEQADQSAAKANEDSDKARVKAREVAPEFHQPGKNNMHRDVCMQLQCNHRSTLPHFT